jgi:LmbE family N-acetylglucosaminyl deacetylase
MLTLQIDEPNTVLCIGAHCDDIEIGCAGTLLGWASRCPSARFVWVVFSGDEERIAETRAAAVALLGPAARLEIRSHEFRDGYFPSQYAEIKEAFHALRSQVEPTLVLTHHEHDRHQDHRLLAELTWQTFRDHMILEYEVPKYDGDLGSPNVFVPLSAELARRKAELLMASFASQAGKSWFTADTFMGLMRLRGIECRSSSGFAEAFFARKLILGA